MTIDGFEIPSERQFDDWCIQYCLLSKAQDFMFLDCEYCLMKRMFHFVKDTFEDDGK